MIGREYVRNSVRFFDHDHDNDHDNEGLDYANDSTPACPPETEYATMPHRERSGAYVYP